MSPFYFQKSTLSTLVAGFKPLSTRFDKFDIKWPWVKLSLNVLHSIIHRCFNTNNKSHISYDTFES